MAGNTPAARRTVRLAILGCGAVTERFHLPAATAVPEVEITLLVDRDLDRARGLARRFRIPKVREDHREVARSADAVLVALPNRWHGPTAIDLLTRGIPVLVEKPMACTSAEAIAMIQASRDHQALLQIGLMKRFALAARDIKVALEQGSLGTLAGFSVEWGENFSWPLTSGGGMIASEAGGGVLMDFGSHLIDLLCWWMGTPEVVRYVDDNRGGVEADCEGTIRMDGPSGAVVGEVRFSRIRQLSNTICIWGDRGRIEWPHHRPDRVRFFDARDDQPGKSQSLLNLFEEQLRSFAHAVAARGDSPVSGESVAPSLGLIEQCYRIRRSHREPWEVPVELPQQRAVIA